MSRTAAPPLMAIFRSQNQAEILAAIMLDPGQHSVTDLAQRLDVPFSTVHREVARLIEAGLAVDERVGKSRLVSPNTDNPAYGPLRDLVLVAFGPRTVIEQEFAGLPGMEGLFIYGSWAAGYNGEQGKVPGDIDVLVVGAVDRDAAYDAADAAQKRLGREVNPQVVSTTRWNSSGTPFLKQLRDRPLVTLRDPSTAPSLLGTP